MKKKIYAVLLVFCVTLSSILYPNDISVVSAAEIAGENYGKEETFEVSGVIFGILDADAVSLVDGRNVVGDYEIPSEVVYNGNTYKVVSIASGAFYNNQKLTSVVMPDTITMIEDANVKYIDKNLVDYVGPGAFKDCNSLSSITFSPNLTYIGKVAFSNCSNLVSVTLPDKLESIADEAFINCSGITSLQIPESVTTIGQCAFFGTSLKTFTIPATCTHFDDWALDYIETLESVNVGEGHPNFKSINGIVYTKDMSGLVIYPQGKKDQIFEIPEGVTTIRLGIFGGVKNLVKVVFPTTCSVDSLEPAAFQGSGIEEFEVAEGNPYLSTIDGVLFTADKKTILAYPTGNTQKIYFIPDGTENIGKEGVYVFDKCPYIEEVYIPSSVRTFDTVMWYCENLKKVVYAKDSKISAVYGECFQGSGLESICLPASINKFSSAGNNFFDSVGNEFVFCYNLKTMYVAKGAGLYNCDYFGSQTLDQCYNLTIFGEGMNNAVSALADKFNRPYIDVSSGCDRVLGITFDDTCVSIEEGETVQQKAFVYPESTENKTVTYESSDPSIATVDENGNISGIALGICHITATATDGSGEYARCKVTVENTDTVTVKNETEEDKVTVKNETEEDKVTVKNETEESKVTVAEGGKAEKSLTYTVTFKNGTEESKVTVAEGEKVEKPVDPELEGYRFDGWFAEDATKAFDFKTAINGDITLTAKRVKLKSITAVAVKVTKAVYTGKIQKPKIIVTYKGKKLTPNKDYKLEYGSYKKIGEAQVKIIGINNYMGIKEISYDIIPKKNELISLSNVKGKKLNVKFSKATGAKKYEIYYSTNKNFKDAKKVSTTKTNVTLKNLKKGKLYYVKVRSCAAFGKKMIYSDYSKVMKKIIIK